MRLFILAAGTGSRLYPLTKNTPKSLIDFGLGSTLLERQIELATKTDQVKECIIITGYKASQIDAKIEGKQDEIPVKTIYNPFYDISNNLISVWCGEHLFQDQDFAITNGDNLYKDSVVPLFDRLEEGIWLTISHKEEYDEDDMKVEMSNNGKVLFISKEIDLEKVQAESVGLVFVKGEIYRRLFRNKVLNLVKQKKYLNRFWLDIFNSLIDDGITIQSVEIDSEDWFEMDFHPDVEIISSQIKNKISFV